ncbi:MAG: hypothetical protein IKK33_16110 [Lachnospiraceae bacterium]|nr:hypothetical protein [Lachnospiraceae bacterium]
MKKIFIVLVVIIAFVSCDSYDRKLTGVNFSVGWVNLPELTNIYYDYPEGGSIGILMQRITDVYWNEKYILAKRCANTNDSVIGYYIVTILPEGTRPVPWKSSELLTNEEYEKAKNELGLKEENMKHTNIFERKFLWW